MQVKHKVNRRVIELRAKINEIIRINKSACCE